MARSGRRDGGFWLFEMIGSFWRRFVRFFKRSRSVDELIADVQEQAKGMATDAYWTGVDLDTKRRKLEAEVAKYHIIIDKLTVRRRRAVTKGTKEGDIEALGYDQEIKVYTSLVAALDRQLAKTLTTPQIRAIVRRNIVMARVQAARAHGYAAQIRTTELLGSIAGLQESMAGLTDHRGLWQIDELQRRADDGRLEVESRLELSADLAQTMVDEDQVMLLGEPSLDLVALMQERDAGELVVDDEDGALAELDKALVGLGPEV